MRSNSGHPIEVYIPSFINSSTPKYEYSKVDDERKKELMSRLDERRKSRERKTKEELESHTWAVIS